jgi:2-(1,2-epoxy-1,2-dihydrophenyl)acetyl-CoA isomerase
VHAAHKVKVDRTWQAKRTDRAPLQFGHHMVKARGCLVARHQAAAKHLVAAIVRVMGRVVEDQHRVRLSRALDSCHARMIVMPLHRITTDPFGEAAARIDSPHARGCRAGVKSRAMEASKLIMSVQDGVLTLSLNRPEKLNAIDNELSCDLLSALTTAGSDPAIRVVMINGNGRAFCAGRDISAAPTDEDLVLVQAVSKAIVDLTKPVIAAVHGWTVGAGLEWMLNADVVIAASSARFKLPEAAIGVFVTGGLTATLAAYAGLARAKALMLLGEEFSPAQALAWGLVWRVVAPDELALESRRMAEQIASLRPEVVSQYKRVLNAVGMPNFHRAIELESEAQRALSGQQGSAG